MNHEKIHHTKWLGRLGACFLCLIVAGATVGKSAEEMERHEMLDGDLIVERLSDSIWRHISYQDVPGFGRSPGNGLVVIAAEEAVLIDTPWTDAQTRALFDWVSSRLDTRIIRVVVTHSHDDCLGGLAAAHELGASSYAFEITAALARQNGKEVPQNRFSDTMNLEVGDRVIQIHYPGAGHTVDNTVVWIPDQRLLFGGCLIKSGTARTIGYIKEADLEQWPATLQGLIDRYEDVHLIVPGHGRPGGTELIERTLELIQENSKGDPVE